MSCARHLLGNKHTIGSPRPLQLPLLFYSLPDAPVWQHDAPCPRLREAEVRLLGIRARLSPTTMLSPVPPRQPLPGLQHFTRGAALGGRSGTKNQGCGWGSCGGRWPAGALYWAPLPPTPLLDAGLPERWRDPGREPRCTLHLAGPPLLRTTAGKSGFSCVNQPASTLPCGCRGAVERNPGFQYVQDLFSMPSWG